MVGGQHRAAGFQLSSALKSGRFLLLLAAVVVLPLAALGLVCYLIVAGTDAERLGAGLVGPMILLINAIVRRRDQAFMGWTAAGLVLVTASQLATIYPHHLTRPNTHTVTLISHGLFAAAVVCIAVATVIGARSCLQWWRKRRLAQP
jgi:hypothetical protein